MANIPVGQGSDPSHLLEQGVAFHRRGQLAEAERAYRQILDPRPDHAEARRLLGILRTQQGRHAEALVCFEQALAHRPDYAEAHNNRGNVLEEMGRTEEALASYERAVASRPGYTEALHNRGNMLAVLGRFAEALESYDLVLSLTPSNAEALSNRGNVLAVLGRPQEALASYERALLISPSYADAQYNRGNVLAALSRNEDALASYDRALAVRPDYVQAYDNRGNVLLRLRRLEEALASYDRALAIDPGYAEAFNNRGTVLKELKRHGEALASFDRALAIRPDDANALYGRGNALKEIKRYDEALASYDRARALNPEHPDAFGLVDAALAACDWARVAAVGGALAAQIRQGNPSVTPFTLVGFCDDPALHLQCAKNFVEERIPARPPPLWSGPAVRHDRIKIAYLSADFHAHATAYLVAELFELHDRSRFEIVGLSFGRDDGSDTRARLIKSFDQFHDVRAKGDREIAALVRALDVDVAVDLKGYTQDARIGIFAHRGAPIQVSYLGYPGTTGADFMDYIVADATVLPFDQQPFYTEKIVHLPDCYQVNDSKRRIADATPNRKELGLPEQGFVFCSFNNNYKITAPVFDVWMRLLDQVPGSVLWLLRDNDGAERNLRGHATARGVDPTRLIFAGRKPLDEHLARHRVADLFLDTLPYNAHTTASDALWAGVPVVTCQGQAFAGRVAGSLLRAAGVPGLVTHSLADYEALALRLATDGPMLGAVRERLAANRGTATLFDADRFRRHIEAAYRTMWDIWQRGDVPQSFAVEADAASRHGASG